MNVPVWAWAAFAAVVVILLAIDLLAHRGAHIIGFREAAWWSALWVGVALIFGATILYETLMYGKSVPGYPSLVVGLMVLGGVQLVMIGVMGEYIGKILSEQKARPVYFVAEHHERHVQSDQIENADDDARSSAAE